MTLSASENRAPNSKTMYSARLPDGRDPSPIPFEDGWGDIKDLAFDALVEKIERGGRVEFDNEQRVHIYSVCYNMCTQKKPYNWSGRLYAQFKQCISGYLNETVLRSLKSKGGEALLRELVRRWRNHQVMTKWLTRFFSYLDRFYVKRLALPRLKKVAVDCFRELVFMPCSESICDSFIGMMTRERRGERVNQSLLGAVSGIYVELGEDDTAEDLGVYREHLEQHILQTTQVACAESSKRWILADGCAQYARKAESRIEEEADRVEQYLHSSTMESLMSVVERELLAKPAKELLSSPERGAVALFKSDSRADLTRIFRLYSRGKRVKHGLKLFSMIMRKHIATEGTKMLKGAVVTKRKDAANKTKNQNEMSDNEVLRDTSVWTLVKRMVIVHDHYTGLIDTCFQTSSLFHDALKRGYEDFINLVLDGKVKVPELLADYYDRRLRRDLEFSDLSLEQLDEAVGTVTTVFTYVRDKDVFQEFYRKQMAKRLLLRKSTGEDAEMVIILKLRKSVGNQFTTKFEGMLRDMNCAKDIQGSFEAWMGENGRTLGGLDFSLNVLTQGFWPPYKEENMRLPGPLQRCKETFSEYYNSKTKNRILSWIHNLGFVTVKSDFSGKPVEMVMSTYQACILLLFNENEHASLTPSDMAKRLEVEDSLVIKHLSPLVVGKFPILCKASGGAGPPSASELIRINGDFEPARRKIKIPLLAAKTTNKERGKNMELINEQRKHMIDASAVRFMKASKEATLAQIVSAVTSDLSSKFMPQPQDIEKRVQDLISRDYMELSDTKKGVLQYVS